MTGAATNHAQAVPRAALAAAGVLVIATILLAALGRSTGIGVTRQPQVPVVAQVEVYFTDEADGSVRVTRASDAEQIGVMAPGTNGFARSTLRGLVRERRRSHLDASQPFSLIRWADGRLSLRDSVTARTIDLDVFGPANVDAFARLLIAGTH